MVSALHAHLVFVTRYRHGVPNGEHIRYPTQMFSNICGDFGVTAIECNGAHDHVHLLAEYSPKIPITTLVNP